MKSDPNAESLGKPAKSEQKQPMGVDKTVYLTLRLIQQVLLIL